MHNQPTIQFLHHNQVDKPRWDECIDLSTAGLIYGKTFYLDNLCPGWKALAAASYEWVLPLTHKTKWGFSYLYQPAFMQQSGVFAKPGVAVPYKEILLLLRRHYSFCDINWNYQNLADNNDPEVKISAATNFILPLSRGYESIAGSYRKDLVKNLKRSRRSNLSFKQTDDYKTCIRLYKQHYGERMKHVKERDYENFSNVCAYALQHKLLVCRAVTNENAEIVATALLLTDGKRLYNLMNTTTVAGRSAGANHFLLDAVIHEFAGQELLFDFEGSDLPGVKEFYANFGAVDQPYYFIRYNTLPWPFRLFKK